MQASLIDHLTRGNYTFLRPTAQEIRRVVRPIERAIPDPQPIYLEQESAAPLLGFPILLHRGLSALDEALVDYLDAEEEAQFAFVNRDTFDSRAFANRWERYRKLLEQVMENVAVSSFGQNYPSVFWLYHSQHIAQRLKAVPKNVLRRDLQIGREQGDEIKYRVFFKYLDRVVSLCQDLAQRLSSEIDEPEEGLFPALLAHMHDNVLVLSEDYISPDLSELQSYFQGCLQIDGRDFRQRLAALDTWHGQKLRSDPILRSAAQHLLDAGPELDGTLHHGGYVSFLRSHPGYDEGRFLRTDQLQVWESLLVKLKEYEILNALRKMIVPLERQGETLVSQERSMSATWLAGPKVLKISPATRPIDFTAGWVVDPLVSRYGLIYDITDFSAVISLLGRSEKSALDDAFQMTFRFQRRVNQLALYRRLKMEKYLGDGAFYSGRNSRRMLATAIYLQRAYRQALEQSFPFDRGMRIALNYGQYRLLPLDTGDEREGPVYEFFGHGLVELSRLTTGKATQEIDEIKTYLITHGYPEATVNKFFAPMLRKNMDLVNKDDEARRFYAYINENGALINEGIVATEPFIARLGEFDDLAYTRDRGRGYIVVEIEDDTSAVLRIGMRKLGFAKLKGLEQIPLFELVDGADWQDEDLKKVPPQSLMSALDRLFASAMNSRRQQAEKARTQASRPAAPAPTPPAADDDLDATRLSVRKKDRG